MAVSSQGVRALAALLVVAVLAGLAWFLIATRAPPVEEPDVTVDRAPEVGVEPADSDPDLAASGGRVAGAPARDSVRVEPELASDPGEGPVWTLTGRLVAADTEEPLPGHLIFVLLVGTAPTADPVPRGQRVITGTDGVFNVSKLTRPGPWDVYTYPLEPTRARRFAVRDARVGAGTAEKEAHGEPQVYRTRVGPTVVLRSPLPGDVRVDGLLVEVREPHDVLSSDMRAPGGFSRMHRAADGFLRGRLPHVGPGERDKGFGVRIVSEDGLWSLARAYPGTLSDATVIELDESLEPRAKVALRLVVEGSEGAAAPFVGWELPLGDPTRDELGLPESLVANEVYRRLVPTGPDTWEIHDLPVGPVAIRRREHVDHHGDAPVFEVVGSATADALHGDPPAVSVRLKLKQ